MAGTGPTIQLLASIPAFAGLDAEQLQTLYGFCALKTISKGEAASHAGAPVDELSIIVSGRIAATEPGAQEAGQGEPVEAGAFFTRSPARATAVALRDMVLLTLGWDDLIAALQTSPDLLGALIARLWPSNGQSRRAAGKLSRLAVCPAGSQRRLDPGVKEALLAGLENLAEVRLLGSQSFGAGMPGALAVDTPEIAHWLQEQELEFDITVTVPEEADSDFAMEAIEEADGILFIANGGDTGLSALERHALEVRGAKACRLVLAKSASAPSQSAAWFELRSYATVQAVDFAQPDAVRLLCQSLLGQGHAIAAASRGVYAAAIWGALQAFEAHGQPAVCLTAAGSAILPAGLLACGVEPAAIEAIFRELASPLLWKRASRIEAGLCDSAALDSFLVGALQGLEIPAAGRPFAAISHSLSTGAAEVHREGRLHGAVRAGLAPPGILPPLILEAGDILVSGEIETGALVSAARGLTSSPVTLLQANPPPLGASSMSYRSLTGSSLFRLTQSSIDKRVRLETVLGAGGAGPGETGALRTFAIPIPEGIGPMDWPQWAMLRDAAYEWASKELGARDRASDING
ncbi:MAG: cyclic nucleotide-binding domain-containing protein [Rhodomicrobium sp.]